MHFDTTLKAIFTRSGSVLPAELGAAGVIRWLNVELPKVRNLRVDLLGESETGDLFHVDVFSENERDVVVRMGEYKFAILRITGRMPFQIVLYVGNPPLNMPDTIEGPDIWLRVHVVDIRDLNGEALLASPNPGDNVIALLTRLGEQPGTVRRILERLAQASEEERGQAAQALMILAGLRKRAVEIRREVEKMPISMSSILEDPYFSGLAEEAREKGLEKGRQEGRQEGRQQGLEESRKERIDLLRCMIEKRFGRISPGIAEHLTHLNPEEAKMAALRLLDAECAEDLFVK